MKYALCGGSESGLSGHGDGFYCLSVLEEVLQQRGQLELRDEVQARPSDAASDAEAAQLAEGAGRGCKTQAGVCPLKQNTDFHKFKISNQKHLQCFVANWQYDPCTREITQAFTLPS